MFSTCSMFSEEVYLDMFSSGVREPEPWEPYDYPWNWSRSCFSKKSYDSATLVASSPHVVQVESSNIYIKSRRTVCEKTEVKASCPDVVRVDISAKVRAGSPHKSV